MNQWRVEIGDGRHGGYEPGSEEAAFAMAHRFSRDSPQPVTVFHRPPWEKRWAKRHAVATFRNGEEA